LEPNEHNDRVAEFDVDPADSRKLDEAIQRRRRLGSLT
jgi:hypothetical protein